MSLKRLQLLIGWLLGFSLIVNMYLVPSLQKTPRVTDVLGAALGLWFLWRFATVGLRVEPLIALSATAIVPSVWGLYAYFQGDTETVVVSARWFLAVPWGYALFTLARDPEQRTSLIWGVLSGCIVSAVVLPFQYYGFLELTQSLGLAARDAIYPPSTAVGSLHLDNWRTPGMETHPNSSTAVISIAIPLSLYLYYTRTVGIWVVVTTFGILIAAVQFTETRSAVLVSLITTLTVIFTHKDLKRSLGLVAVFVCVGLPILARFGPPAGWERWTDSSSQTVNLTERLLSNIGALQVLVQHPLGLGLEAGEQVLQQENFNVVVHNALLQVAIVYGLPLAVALTLLMCMLALQTLKSSQLEKAPETVLAFQTLGLFFFEEHLTLPTFLILINWLIAAGAVFMGGYLLTSKFRLDTSRPEAL